MIKISWSYDVPIGPYHYTTMTGERDFDESTTIGEVKAFLDLQHTGSGNSRPYDITIEPVSKHEI